jgi:hypothetical protein
MMKFYIMTTDKPEGFGIFLCLIGVPSPFVAITRGVFACSFFPCAPGPNLRICRERPSIRQRLISQPLILYYLFISVHARTEPVEVGD